MSIQQALLGKYLGVWVSAQPSDGTSLPASAAAYFTSVVPGVTYALCGTGWPGGISINPATGILSGSATGTFPGLALCAITPGGTVISTATFSLTLVGFPVNRVVTVGSIAPYSYYSDDHGVTWTAAGSGLPGGTNIPGANALAFGANVMVVTPDSGLPRYTQDGINWTVCSGVSIIYGAVYYNGSYFLAIASGTAAVAKSVDGINWTEFTRTGSWVIADANFPVAWNSVRSEWLSAQYNAASYGTADIFVSSDGIAWSTASSFSTQSFSAAMCSSTGTYALLDYNASTDAQTGTDSVTWGSQTVITSNFFLHGIFANGNFVGLSLGGTAVISPTGATWTRRFLPAGTWSGVTWDGTNYIACSQGTNMIATSPTGVTWTARSAADINQRAIRAATAY